MCGIQLVLVLNIDTCSYILSLSFF